MVPFMRVSASELFRRGKVLSMEPAHAAGGFSMWNNPIAALAAPCMVAFLAIAPIQAIAQTPEALPPTQGPGQGPGATGNARTCLPHDRVDTKLQREFGERELGRGVSADGTLIEIFMAPSGNFTVVKTTPGGVSCVVDFGEGWQPLNQLESVGFTPDDLKKLNVEPTPF
jgi:hypothetical protein